MARFAAESTQQLALSKKVSRSLLRSPSLHLSADIVGKVRLNDAALPQGM